MTTGTDLRVAGVRKAFDGPDVLHDVSLSVAAGELVAILGASGSGKTTLLRLVCGFERLDAGEVALGGRVVAGPGLHVATEHRRVGYVAQEGALFPHLSVGENVLFGLPRRDRRDHRRARLLLQQVGLPAAYAERGPHQLSGGEQQRVALARALAPAPRLVLLDEPFSALDAALRVETRRAVAASLAAAGATAVLVTHDQAEALSLGQRVAVLRRGAVVQFDTPDALYRHPADLDVARFVGDAVLVPGEGRGSQAQCCLGALPLAAPAHGAVTVMVRPEQVRLGDGGAPARVSTVLFHGPDAAVGLLLAGGEAVTARVAGHAVPAIGCQLHVAVEGPVIAFAADRTP